MRESTKITFTLSEADELILRQAAEDSNMPLAAYVKDLTTVRAAEIREAQLASTR